MASDRWGGSVWVNGWNNTSARTVFFGPHQRNIRPAATADSSDIKAPTQNGCNQTGSYERCAICMTSTRWGIACLLGVACTALRGADCGALKNLTLENTTVLVAEA